MALVNFLPRKPFASSNFGMSLLNSHTSACTPNNYSQRNECLQDEYILSLVFTFLCITLPLSTSARHRLIT